MKRVLSLIMTIVLMLVIFPISANASDENIIAKVKDNIEAKEDININIIDFEILYDIEDKPSYLLIVFKEGYTIVSRQYGVISELSLMSSSPYSIKDVKKYYFGPFNYYEGDDFLFKNRSSSNTYHKLIELNRNFLSIKPSINTLNNAENKTDWIELSPNRFSRYSDGMWINNTSTNYPPSEGYNENGLCGTISSAIMLAYFDDYINDSYVPSSIRNRYSSSPGSLISTLYEYIDEGKNGTIPNDLAKGINYFLDNYTSIGNDHKALFGTTTFQAAKKYIGDNKPLCIGFLEHLGFQDHWVVAYGYLDAPLIDDDMYKCVDTWGDYIRQLNVTWSAGFVGIADY